MKNLKWIIVFLLALVVNVNSAEATNGVSIYIDGEHQTYSDLAVIENGRTLVPLRGIFESLGASIKWDNTEKTVSAYRGNTEIWLKIGSINTKVNGETVTISVPGQIQNGRTLVPLRFISESLGERVGWNNTTKTVTLTSSHSKLNIPVVDRYYNAENQIQYTVFEDGLRVGTSFHGIEDLGTYEIQRIWVGFFADNKATDFRDLRFSGYNVSLNESLSELSFVDNETRWMENFRFQGSLFIPANSIRSNYVFFYDTPMVDRLYLKTEDRMALIYES